MKIAVAVVSLLLFVGRARAEDVRVMTSGAFTAPYLEIIPQYESETQNHVLTAFGPSMGDTASSIPNRLKRGEPVDVVILASSALEELIQEGKVLAGSRVDLVRSTIGMAVRKGAPKPDIHSVEALKRTLLQAKSIAYSSSASGIYLSTELFPSLEIADQIRGKSRKVESGPVGEVVARGDAEIGFQQISELLPVAGIEFVGPLPAEVQRITVFSAGIAASSKKPEVARALIQFLASPAATMAITKSGLEQVR